MRCSNSNETYHNNMFKKCGEHKPLWQCIRGMQDLENIDVMRWMNQVIHQIEPKRDTYYVEREKKIKQVWDAIDKKMALFEGRLQEIEHDFWMKSLFAIHNIMYPIDKNKDHENIDEIAAKVIEEADIDRMQ